MPKPLKTCLNESRIMKNGMKATCVIYRSSKDIDVLFEDGFVAEHIQKIHFYNGSVTNPNAACNHYKRIDCLSSTNPELMTEWDFDKNKINPNNITRNFNKKVWWKCEHGHEWEATVVARTRKNPTGCPYCKGCKAITGETDLASQFTEVMLDWDYEKNSGIDPTKLTKFSGLVVNWKCHFCGHTWRTAIYNRTSNKRNCPNCSMKSTSFGEQAVYFYVKKIFPEAINRYRKGRFELDIYIPEIQTGIEFDGFYFHSGNESLDREKRKYERCQELGIKLIRLKDSNSMNGQCYADETFGIENLKDRNQLNTLIRLLLQKIDPQSNILTKRNPKQDWSTIDNLIDVEKDFYDILGDKYLREEKKSFLNIKPELLLDWDYEENKNINPKSITKACSFKINWKCHVCGYKWKARVSDRLRGDQCACCACKQLVEGVNDFATLYPQGLSDWDYEENELPPNKVCSKNIKIAWKCSKCGYKWKSTINDRFVRNDKTGCPNCGRKAIALKRHQRALKNGSAFERFPDVFKFWDYEKNIGVDVNDLAAGSGARYFWKCPDCGHEWITSLANATKINRHFGCSKCKKKYKKTSK